MRNNSILTLNRIYKLKYFNKYNIKKRYLRGYLYKKINLTKCIYKKSITYYLNLLYYIF